MKNLMLVAILSVFFCQSHAQDAPADNDKNGIKTQKDIRKSRCPGLYLTISTGLNNNTGLIGGSLDLAVAKYVSIDAGVGIGSWGEKFALGAKYYLEPCHRGWAFGGGISYETGLNNYQNNMETIDGYTEPVVLNLLPQTNLFFAAYRYWNIGKRHSRCYIELGYSKSLTTNKWEQVGGTELSSNSVNVMNILSPGGIIVAAGFSFGLN